MSEAKYTALGGRAPQGYPAVFETTAATRSRLVITVVLILLALVLVTAWDSSLSSRR